MAADSQTTNPSQALDTTKPTLPPAEVFDILPALHELLARIDHAPTSGADSQLQPTSSSSDGSTADEGNDIGAHYLDQPPLEPKDLPTEVLAIKAKIRKALREVEKLPDMDVSVEEQEEEIRELEERIRRQKAMVARFGEMGGASGLG